MALNRDDSSKLNYKAKIGWYKERIAALSTGFVNPSAVDDTPDADQYIQKLDDIKSKVTKLDTRIDSSCAGKKIPIDKAKDPDISETVAKLDPASNGSYVTYELYTSVLNQIDAGRRNIKVDDIISNSSNDGVSNSQLIQDRIFSGYQNYVGRSNTDNNQAQEYVNQYLNKITSWEAHDADMRQVVHYSDFYLGTFKDPSLHEWYFKRDLVAEHASIDGWKELWKSFSVEGSNGIETLGGSIKGLVSLRPDQNIASVTDRYLDYSNKFLNNVHDMLDNSWTADLICCFMKFAVKLDLKTLQAFRAMLELLKYGINASFGDLLSTFKDMFNNIMRDLILNQLMGLVMQMIQRLFEPVKKWLNKLNDIKILDCVPVKLFLQKYLNASVDYIEKFFNDILNELYKDIEMKQIYRDAKVSQFGENKWINQTLKLLDSVISVIELSALCGMNGTPNSSDVQKVVDSYGLNDGSQYTYPIEDNPNIYNSFITPEQQAEIESAKASGDTTAAAKVMNRTKAEKQALIASKLDDCRRNITSADMPPPIDWSLMSTNQT